MTDKKLDIFVIEHKSQGAVAVRNGPFRDALRYFNEITGPHNRDEYRLRRLRDREEVIKILREVRR